MSKHFNHRIIHKCQTCHEQGEHTVLESIDISTTEQYHNMNMVLHTMDGLHFMRKNRTSPQCVNHQPHNPPKKNNNSRNKKK